jgi:hypothetical protein
MILLFVVPPALSGSLDVRLLGPLGAPAEEDYHRQTVLPDINSVARTGVFENQLDDTFAYILTVPKQSLAYTRETTVNLHPAFWITEALKPLVKRAAAILPKVLFNCSRSSFHLLPSLRAGPALVPV